VDVGADAPLAGMNVAASGSGLAPATAVSSIANARPTPVLSASRSKNARAMLP